MAITVLSSGSTASTGSEATLVTDTSNRVCVFVIDTNVLTNGDTIEIKIKTKTLSGSTAAIAYYAVYANVQNEPVKYSVPVPANNSIAVTIKRTAGSDRTYDWALLGL